MNQRLRLVLSRSCKRLDSGIKEARKELPSQLVPLLIAVPNGQEMALVDIELETRKNRDSDG